MNEDIFTSIEAEAEKLARISLLITESEAPKLATTDISQIEALGEEIIKICHWDTDPEMQNHTKFLDGLKQIMKNPSKKNITSDLRKLFQEPNEELDEDTLSELDGIFEGFKILEGVSVPEDSIIYSGGHTANPPDQLEAILNRLLSFRAHNTPIEPVKTILDQIESIALEHYNKLQPDDQIVRL